MADFITAIRTTEGDKKYDYNALGNLPEMPKISDTANAIKGTAAGEIITVDDVSPVEHNISCRLTSNTLIDFSSVKVSRYGKNLIDDNKKHFNLSNIFFGINEVPTANTGILLQAGIYTLSVEIEDGLGCNLYVLDGASSLFVAYGKTSLTFELTEEKRCNFKVYHENYTSPNNLICAQLEVGNSVTPYKTFIEPTTYTPNADGTVEGITSLSPNMTLLTDTDGAIIECEYNRDANKVIAELIALIGSGGGGSASYISYITLSASKWQGAASPYSQVVTVAGATEYSKIDINPSVEQLAIFHQKDIAFVAENEDGVVTVYCIGQKPTADYTMQITVTEVLANG